MEKRRCGVIGKLAAIVALGVLVLALLGGCGNEPKVNDPANLAELPYTLAGSNENWRVEVVVRNVAEQDFAMLQEKPTAEEMEKLLEGYRTVIRIQYLGTEDIYSLKYIFDDENNYYGGGELRSPNEKESLNYALNGQQNLGGGFFDKEVDKGGILPVKSGSYSFAITSKTLEGKKSKEKLTLTAATEVEE